MAAPSAVEVQTGSGCRRRGKSPNNKLIYLLEPVTLYSMLGFERTFLVYCDRKQQKELLLIKTLLAVVYNTLWVKKKLCQPNHDYNFANS